MHPRLDFQRRHSTGRVLNVGSKEDPALLKSDFKALNLDVNRFPNVDVIADARHLPFKSKSFDVIVLGDCLEHIENHEKVIEEARRVGGRLVVTVPTEEHQKEIGHRPEGYRFSQHINNFTAQQLKALFPKAQIFQRVRRQDWIGFLILE